MGQKWTPIACLLKSISYDVPYYLSQDPLHRLFSRRIFLNLLSTLGLPLPTNTLRSTKKLDNFPRYALCALDIPQAHIFAQNEAPWCSRSWRQISHLEANLEANFNLLPGQILPRRQIWKQKVVLLAEKICFQMDHFFQPRFLASKSSPIAKLRPPAKSPFPGVFKNALKLPPSQN